MTHLFRTLARLPLWPLHGLGWLLGWMSFLLSPTYRRRFLDNTVQAGYRMAQVRGAVGAAGRMVGELPRLWLGAPLHCEWDNDACVDTRLWGRSRA